MRRHARVFEILLRRSQEGILLVTPEMSLLRVVHPVIRNPSPELVGYPVLPLIHPDDASGVRAAFEMVLSGEKQTVLCECRAADSAGSYRWLELQMTDMLEDPDIAAILFNYRDITLRKELAERAHCLDAYLACPEFAMFSEDRDGVILDWNAGAELAFGFSGEEMVGQNISRLIPEHLRGKETDARAKVLRGEQVPGYASSRLRREGGPAAVWVNLTAIPGGHRRAIAQISRMIESVGPM